MRSRLREHELALPGLGDVPWQVVRWELFCFRDVRDVTPGDRPGSVVVRHEGEPAPAAWRHALVEAGFALEGPTSQHGS